MIGFVTDVQKLVKCSLIVEDNKAKEIREA
jgi:hypothetical protein